MLQRFHSISLHSCFSQRRHLHPFSFPPPWPREEEVTKRIHALCTDSDDVDSAVRLLDHARLLGHRPNARNLSSILHALCRSSRFPEAHRRALLAFSSLWIPDHRTSNVLLSLLLRARTPHLTIPVLRSLLDADPSFIPSRTVYNRLISHLCSASDPFAAYRVLLDMRERGQSPDCVSYTAIIDGFARCGYLNDALKVFDEMLKRGVPSNSITYSALVKAFLRKRMFCEARSLTEKLWKRMAEEEDGTVNSASFANLLDALCREGCFQELFHMAEEMPQGDSVSKEFAYGQMIDALCRFKRYHGASRIVYIMRKRSLIPSLTSYNFIIHNLSKGGEGGCMRAYQLFEEGLEFGYSLPEPTYKVLVEALCRERDLKKAKVITEHMLRKDEVSTIRVYNIFLSAVRIVDNPIEQLNVLMEMLQDQCKPDVVTLNTVIHGFCKVGKVEEAKEILKDMLCGKFCAPDAVTFTTIMSALLGMGRVEEALGLLHVKMLESGCKPNTTTYNVVIHGLFKNREAGRAMDVFREMIAGGTSANSTTYSVMTSGLLAEGRVQEVKSLWDDLIWPFNIHDDFVYAAILRGLCTLGKLNEACDFLYELVDCGVSPGIVNYNILIDCACKLGLKKEAYKIVGEMRKNGLKPDPVTWRILDKLHRNSSKNHLHSEEILETEVTSEFNCADKIITFGKEEQVVESKKSDEVEVIGRVSFSASIPESCCNEHDHVEANGHPILSICVSPANVSEEHLHFQPREPLFKVARRSFGLP